jgi:phosphinothricin acetyltransferase
MIREAVADDANEIAAIYNHYVEHTIVTFEEDHVTAREVQRRMQLSAGRHPWLVAEVVGTVMGYAYAAPWHPRSAYRHSVETTVYVDPGQLRRGIGTNLYGALLDELKGGDLRCALACIALPNAASVALHENFGFDKVGHMAAVGHKFDRWVDVGYWQLQL